MTRQLFMAGRLDQLDYMTFIWTDCTINKAFGPFADGDKVTDIVIDFARGEITVHTNPQQKPWRGKLTLTVEAA